MNGVAIYIYVGTEPYRLELFKDEKINLTSTIQQINDIGKVFTDFTQTFTIPASPYNNSIFNHWYESFVDYGYDHRIRSNAYITIDGALFREGKIQIEKGQYKNGYMDNYSVTFYGNLTQLKDRFKDDVLSVLDYSNLNHSYTATEVINRITTTASYSVKYPIIGASRRYTYRSGDAATDISLNSGAIVWNELFPAIKVTDILTKIGQYYGITFSGSFLQYNQFRNLWLYCKTTETVENYTPETTIDIVRTDNPGVFSTASNTITTTNNFWGISGSSGYTAYYTVYGRIRPQTTPNKYRVYVYKNGVLFKVVSDLVGDQGIIFDRVYMRDDRNRNVYEIKISSNGPMTFKAILYYTTNWYDYSLTGIDAFRSETTYGNYLPSQPTPPNQTTSAFINIKDFIPKIKVEDFFMGLVKMFNLTITPKSPTEYELLPLELYYANGEILDLTEYISSEQMDISRPKLFKRINFSYEKSENILNNKFNEFFSPIRGYDYGDMKYEDINTNENQTYEIKLPFENILWERSFATASMATASQSPVAYDFMTATLVNKDNNTYVPKPVLMYENGPQSFTQSFIRINNGVTTATYSRYIRFSNEFNLGGADLSELYTLNWGEEVSPWYLTNAPRGLYSRLYKEYIKNLYSLKTRLVNVKGILPSRIISEIKLNNRIIIRGKRYVINTMKTDLTSNEVELELITDYRGLTTGGAGFGVGYRFSNVPSVVNDYSSLNFQLVIYKNDFDYFDVGASSDFLSYATSTGNTQDLLLDVFVPTNTTSVDRLDEVPVTYYRDGVAETVSVPFVQLETVEPQLPTDNPPTAPTSMTIVEGVTTLNVSWSGATDDNGILGYEVSYAQRSTELPPEPLRWTNIFILTSSTSGSTTITDLFPATDYIVRVRTQDVSNQYSDYYYNENDPDYYTMTLSPYQYYITTNFVEEAQSSTCAIGPVTEIYVDKLINLLTVGDKIYTNYGFTELFDGNNKYHSIQTTPTSPSFKKNFKIDDFGNILVGAVNCTDPTIYILGIE